MAKKIAKLFLIVGMVFVSNLSALDISKATKAELVLIYGIGDKTADKIVLWQGNIVPENTNKHGLPKGVGLVKAKYIKMDILKEKAKAVFKKHRENALKELFGGSVKPKP